MKVIDQNTIQTYYQALLDRRPDFVGVFYVGVKTTSVFCISTCRARKPKPENVVFYNTLKEALDNGFRPCKVCCPTEKSHDTPKEIEEAIALVKSDPKQKVSDNSLRKLGISPDLVRRWFKANYNITFHTFQRMYRINIAFNELKEGKNATRTAFDSGYGSLSGFGYTYKKILGKSPKNNTNGNIILINRFTTPLGPMFICASEKGITLLEFVDRKMLESEIRDIQLLLGASVIIGENDCMIKAKNQLSQYFEGSRQSFDVPVDAPGTDFQKAVWHNLQKIPYGSTSTYLDQARQLNKPTAVRAMGTANGANRISIIIPCHRVIGSDGKLTGYGGGLHRKQWLLNHEQKHKLV